jgi:hypothetical protein
MSEIRRVESWLAISTWVWVAAGAPGEGDGGEGVARAGARVGDRPGVRDVLGVQHAVGVVACLPRGEPLAQVPGEEVLAQAAGQVAVAVVARVDVGAVEVVDPVHGGERAAVADRCAGGGERRDGGGGREGRGCGGGQQRAAADEAYELTGGGAHGAHSLNAGGGRPFR